MRKEQTIWGEKWTLSDRPSRGLYFLFIKQGSELELSSEEEDVRCFTVIHGTVEVKTGDVSRRVVSPGEEYSVGVGSCVILRVHGGAEIIEERLSLPDVSSGEE